MGSRDQVAGVTLTGREVAWTVLQTAKQRTAVQRAGSVNLAAEPPAPGADPADVAAAEAAAEAAAPRRFRAAFGDLRGPLSLGLSSRHLLLKVVRLPPAADDELQGMAELQVDKFSPFPVENMVVASEVLQRTEESLLVLIAAARSDYVETCGREAQRLGLHPARVDAELLGWWHLLTAGGHIPAQGRHVAVLLAGAVPEIIVAQDGVPLVLRALGEMEGLAPEELDAETAREVGYTLVSLELEHGSDPDLSLAVWSRDGGSELLRERLGQECGCPVRVHSLASLPPVTEGLAQRMAARQGLDLTPAAWRAMGVSLQFRRTMLRAVAAIAGLWLLALASFGGGLLFDQFRLRNMEAERDELRGPATEVRTLRRRVATIRRYLDQQQSALEYLREISALLPPGIDLTALSFRKGESLKISAEASAVGLVYDFKKQLDSSALFPNASLIGPVHDPRRRKETFDIEVPLKDGGENE